MNPNQDHEDRIRRLEQVLLDHEDRIKQHNDRMEFLHGLMARVIAIEETAIRLQDNDAENGR